MFIQLNGNGKIKKIELNKITYDEIQDIIKNGTCFKDMERKIQTYLESNHKLYINYAYQLLMAIHYNYKYLVVV